MHFLVSEVPMFGLLQADLPELGQVPFKPVTSTEREKERERERERERACACERERARARVRERERESACVRERERARGREKEGEREVSSSCVMECSTSCDAWCRACGSGLQA